MVITAQWGAEASPSAYRSVDSVAGVDSYWEEVQGVVERQVTAPVLGWYVLCNAQSRQGVAGSEGV